MKPIVALGVLCMCGIAFDSIGDAAHGDTRSPSGKPLVIISGADSHVVKPSLQLAVAPEEWKRMWAAHNGTTIDDYYCPAMEVDFDRCMVVAMFRGARVNTNKLRIASMSEVADSIHFRIENVGYQTTSDGNTEPPPDRPYAFIVLPKSNKSIVVEENVQIYKQHPPEWKEWLRIENRQKAAQK